MIEINSDGALLLAGAIARQWIREEPQELPAVAAWLGLEADVLRRGLRIQPTPHTDGTCRNCGAPLPAERSHARIRRIYCSQRCNSAAWKQRSAERQRRRANHAAI